MKAKELLTALELPLQIAQRKISTVEIVSHIKLAGGKAAAYNLAAGCEVDLDLKLECCVPAGKFAYALSAIAELAGEASVKLSLKNKLLTMTAPRVRYAMPVLPAADFPEPKWPEEKRPIKDWAKLAAAMKFSVHPCTRADVRPFCHGVIARKEYVGGTDGKRGAIARGESELDGDLVIPLEAVPTICSLQDVTAYSASENALAFHFKSGRYFVQLIAASYPDLAKVFPAEHLAQSATIERDALSSAVAAIYKSRSRDFVRLTADSEKLVIEDQPPNGEEIARVEVLHTYEGEAWDMGVNLRYLVDAIDSLDGKHLTISHKDGQLVLKGEFASRSVIIAAARL